VTAFGVHERPFCVSWIQQVDAPPNSGIVKLVPGPWMLVSSVLPPMTWLSGWSVVALLHHFISPVG